MGDEREARYSVMGDGRGDEKGDEQGDEKETTGYRGTSPIRNPHPHRITIGPLV